MIVSDTDKGGGEGLATPSGWAQSLLQPCAMSSEPQAWRSGLLRRWTGGPGEIAQPPIDHHYIVLHLGGPKQVTRKGEGRTIQTAVEEGALTLVAAGTRYDWSTVGPIYFAHLYIRPARLNDLIASKYDGDPAAVTLDERIGVSDPLLSEVIREMLRQVSHPSVSAHAYLDALMEAALAQLAHKHCTTGRALAPSRHALSPSRLRQVLQFADAHVGEAMRLDDLAEVAGLSRFHFSRSFQSAMGESPMAYVARLRLNLAKRLLRTGALPVAEVASRSGLGTPSQFAATFKRSTGVTPSAYRRRP